MEIGFSLGSNRGDRVRNLRQAHQAILAEGDATEVAVSPLYETEPVDVKPEFQHLKFLNSVLVIETDRTAEDWLARTSRIEDRLGRERDARDRNAPRDIDIDIIFAGDLLIDSGGLTVPHPRWAERRFVVQPLADVRPDLLIPGQNRRVADVLKELPGADELQRLDESW